MTFGSWTCIGLKFDNFWKCLFLFFQKCLRGDGKNCRAKKTPRKWTYLDEHMMFKKTSSKNIEYSQRYLWITTSIFFAKKILLVTTWGTRVLSRHFEEKHSQKRCEKLQKQCFYIDVRLLKITFYSHLSRHPLKSTLWGNFQFFHLSRRRLKCEDTVQNYCCSKRKSFCKNYDKS